MKKYSEVFNDLEEQIKKWWNDPDLGGKNAFKGLTLFGLLLINTLFEPMLIIKRYEAKNWDTNAVKIEKQIWEERNPVYNIFSIPGRAVSYFGYHISEKPIEMMIEYNKRKQV